MNKEEIEKVIYAITDVYELLIEVSTDLSHHINNVWCLNLEDLRNKIITATQKLETISNTDNHLDLYISELINITSYLSDTYETSRIEHARNMLDESIDYLQKKASFLKMYKDLKKRKSTVGV